MSHPDIRLRCKYCRESLKQPIQICGDMHVLCHHCGRHQGNGREHESGQICSNKNIKECELLSVTWAVLDNMVSLSKYRSEICELLEPNILVRPVGTKCKFPSCEWKGFYTALLDHVKLAHPNCVVRHSTLSDNIVSLQSTADVKLILVFNNFGCKNEIYWLIFQGELKLILEGCDPDAGLLKVNSHYKVENRLKVRLCFDKRCDMCFKVKPDLQKDHGHRLCSLCLKYKKTHNCDCISNRVRFSTLENLPAPISKQKRCNNNLDGASNNNIYETTAVRCSCNNVFELCALGKHLLGEHKSPGIVMIDSDVWMEYKANGTDKVYSSFIWYYGELFLIYKRHNAKGLYFCVDHLSTRPPSGSRFEAEIRNYNTAASMRFSMPCNHTLLMSPKNLELPSTRVHLCKETFARFIGQDGFYKLMFRICL